MIFVAHPGEPGLGDPDRPDLRFGRLPDDPAGLLSQPPLEQLTKQHLVDRPQLGESQGQSHFKYGHSLYSGIHTVLWDGQLLCFEMIEDKSSITDVVETCMKVI